MQTVSVPISKPNAKPRHRPNTSELPQMAKAVVEDEMVIVTLEDGRIVHFPIAWLKPVAAATPEQQRNVCVTPWFLFWDDLDEVIGIENILYGNKLYLS